MRLKLITGRATWPLTNHSGAGEPADGASAAALSKLNLGAIKDDLSRPWRGGLSGATGKRAYFSYASG